MDAVGILAQSPLFRLLGAVIVLLVTDWKPAYGVVAFGVWIAWVSSGYWMNTFHNTL